MSKLSTDQATFELSSFDYVKETKTLVAEASTIQLNGFMRLYDDACDYGIAIRSHHTGHVARFAVTKINKDREGDIQSWTLQMTPESCRANPGREDVVVTIFND